MDCGTEGVCDVISSHFIFTFGLILQMQSCFILSRKQFSQLNTHYTQLIGFSTQIKIDLDTFLFVTSCIYHRFLDVYFKHCRPVHFRISYILSISPRGLIRGVNRQAPGDTIRIAIHMAQYGISQYIITIHHDTVAYDDSITIYQDFF